MTAYYQAPLATPLQRGVAYVADAFLALWLWLLPLGVLGLVFDYIPSDTVLFLTWFISHAVYYIVPTALLKATPGKKALRMRVFLEDGRTLTPDVAILRYLIFLVTILVPFGLLISLVLVMTDPNRRALHDRIAGTIVMVGLE